MGLSTIVFNLEETVCCLQLIYCLSFVFRLLQGEPVSRRIETYVGYQSCNQARAPRMCATLGYHHTTVRNTISGWKKIKSDGSRTLSSRTIVI